jgi:hypothetical protein
MDNGQPTPQVPPQDDVFAGVNALLDRLLERQVALVVYVRQPAHVGQRVWDFGTGLLVGFALCVVGYLVLHG